MPKKLIVTFFVAISLGATTSIVLAHTAEQRASLSGDSVAPGPGDPEGTGRAVIRSAPDEGILCYKVYFKGIGRARGAHVHQGPRGVAGPTHMRLFTSKKGKRSPVEGCHSGVGVETIEAMHDDPSNYYVDVHTRAYPDGAVRGQLRNTR
ncbi:MAG TPA: CHRD domain-containing protein [Actinomycetota bacterium]|nr:CHRD domain-containing protein [Actinomycetota bacterium]